MNLRAIGLVSGALLSGLTMGATLAAQQGENQPEPAVSAPQKTVGQWIRELGADSYKDRVAAEQALQKLGKPALDDLQAAAKDTADAEVQWRAKRLIRQIENGGKGGDVQERRDAQDQQDPQGQQPQRTPAARDQFEDVFRRMERDFGVDIPRGRFFRDDFFRDLDQQFRDMQQQMQNLQGRQGQLQGTSQGMSMQVTPDGVRVEVQEKNEKGEAETKVYEAPDMATFKEQYPDVMKQHGLMFGVDNLFGRSGVIDLTPFDAGRGTPNQQIRPWTFGPRGQGNPLEIQPGRRPVVQQALPDDGERLGVFIRAEVPAAVREYLELEDGTGLMVESVADDSLAKSLALQAGDIITAIGDANIGSAQDVRTALSAIEAGKEVMVFYVRKGAKRSASAMKPAMKSAPKAEK